MDPVVLVGLAAGAVTSSGFLPQAIRGWRTKRMDDVSPWMLGVLAAGLTLWLAYGVLRDDVAIIASNALGLTFVLANAALWLRYRPRGRAGAGPRVGT